MNCAKCGKELGGLDFRPNKKYCSEVCRKSDEAKRRRDRKNATKLPKPPKPPIEKKPNKEKAPRGRKFGSKNSTPITRDPNGELSKRMAKDHLYLQKNAARRMVQSYVKKGKIEKPEKCEVCQREARICAHHYRGYDHPLAIIWLCASCHRVAHGSKSRMKLL